MNAGDAPPIFRGVVAHVNGYTQPSLNDLHRLVVGHGGGFLQYLDGKTTVTHIIAGTLTPKKRVEFRQYRIVKPAWVVDSIKFGRLLPWNNYRVVDEAHDQRVLEIGNGKIVNQLGDQQRSYKSQTDGSWYTEQFRRVDNGIPSEPGSQLETSHSVQGPSPSTETTFSEKGSDNSDVAKTAENSQIHTPLDIDHMDDFEPTPGELALKYHSDDSQENVDSEIVFHGNAIEPLPRSTTDTLKRAHSNESSGSTDKTKMTAEEHNRILLLDPYMRKSSAVNPDFIKQYYSQSRLHHLSTWKANLKAQLQRMTAKRSPSQKLLGKPPAGARRYIMHVDFDCFFAAVSLKSAPQYRSKPVVVAHGTGTGSEIASCNYPARIFGVKNGMWMKQALKLCPDLKVLPYNFEAYEEVSKAFYRALLDCEGIVQSVSVDEALVDITVLCLNADGRDGTATREGSISREQANAEEIAMTLRSTIENITGCAISIGIGANILLAKIALRKAKPAGQYLVKPEDVLDLIGELTVESLPGVAHSIGGKLAELGVKSVKDVRGLTKERLATILGPKTGEKIWDFARGIDRTEVGAQVERKSVSAEVNWGIRFENQAQADTFVNSLCGELHNRLQEQRVKAKQLTVKIMRRAADTPLDPPKHLGHGKCDTFNKSVSLGVSTNAHEALAKVALSILKSFGFPPGELRGIGLQATKLEPLKTTGTDNVESSQPRLAFAAASSDKNRMHDGTNGHDAPRSDGGQGDTGVVSSFRSTFKTQQTPPLPSLEKLEPAWGLFDLHGTQFVIPTQVDPNVLAELPAEIRAKLSRPKPKNSLHAQPSARTVSQGQSAVRPPPQASLTESQLDPETLAALPEDMRQEILTTYHKGPITRTQSQSLLPQSPRKNRSLPAPAAKRVNTTPTKRRTGLVSRVRGKHDSNIFTLTQSNFVARALAASKPEDNQADIGGDGHADDVVEGISIDFLDALPDNLRLEVLAEHRRDRLRQCSKLEVSRKSRRQGPVLGNSSVVGPPPPALLPPGGGAQLQPLASHGHGHGPRRLRLPPRPAKATFTTHKLSSLPELRQAISNWVKEFADEGPYDEDVQALSKFLVKVVLDDRNLSKAEAVVRWLDWTIHDNDIYDGGGDDHDMITSKEADASRGGKGAWERALVGIIDVVHTAVKDRGLGPLDLGL